MKRYRFYVDMLIWVYRDILSHMTKLNNSVIILIHNYHIRFYLPMKSLLFLKLPESRYCSFCYLKFVVTLLITLVHSFQPVPNWYSANHFKNFSEWTHIFWSSFGLSFSSVLNFEYPLLFYLQLKLSISKPGFIFFLINQISRLSYPY